MVKRLVMGNEAFAYAALAAGVRVVAGYPGTPSSELIETIAAEHAAGRAAGVHVEWSANEKVALELLAGASLAGARCLFTCKQVGLNVASDALLSLNYVGIKGGLVLFVADDPGPISSQTEQDTRRFASFAKVPVLDPSTVEQGYDMIQAAFDLSESYATPVIVRSSTRICHASTFIDLPEPTQALEASGFERSSRWVIFPRRAFEAHGEIIERLSLIAEDYANTELSRFNPLEESKLSRKDAFSGESNPFGGGNSVREISPLGESNSAEKNEASAIGIVAGGVSASYALDALAMLKERCARMQIELPAYRFIQVGTPYPFPETTMLHFTRGLEAVLVFEELDHVLEDEMLKLCGSVHANYEVYGSLSGYTKGRGENTVDSIFECLAEFFAVADALNETENLNEPAKLGVLENVSRETFVRSLNEGADSRVLEHASDETFVHVSSEGLTEEAKFSGLPGAETLMIPELPVRPPVLCAGCPHRGSFYAIKRALKQMKQEAIFCGDIGCYTLGNAMPLDTVDTCLCMGAGITMAQGFSLVQQGKQQELLNPIQVNSAYTKNEEEPPRQEGQQAGAWQAANRKAKKQIAFVGDSTFFASGLPGIVNAVYNQHDITLAVLDNSITAMTGAQPHPGTGGTLMGARHPGISIEAVLRAVGFVHIGQANPFILEESIQVAKEALQVEGPSAIIYKAPCITLVKPKAPVIINQACVGCKKCITEIGCPAIGFDLKTEKAVINEALCTGCKLCISICPFKVIGGTARMRTNVSLETFLETKSEEASLIASADETRTDKGDSKTGDSYA